MEQRREMMKEWADYLDRPASGAAVVGEVAYCNSTGAAKAGPQPPRY